MKKLLTILFTLSCVTGYSQAYDFYTRGAFYKSMRVYDSTAIRNLINGKADTGSVSGVVSVTGDLVDNADPSNPIVGLTGTHTLLGNASIGLDGNSFSIAQGGNSYFLAVPTPGSEQVNIAAGNVANENYGNLSITTYDAGITSTWYGAYHDSEEDFYIIGQAQVGSSTFEYKADTHTFEGNVILENADTSTTPFNVLTIDENNVVRRAAVGSGVSGVTGDLVDNTTPSNPIVNFGGTHTVANPTILLGGTTLEMSGGAGTSFKIIPSNEEIILTTFLGKQLKVSDDADQVLAKYNDDNNIVISPSGIAVTGNLKYTTPPTGAVTDSILTYNNSTGIVNKRTLSSFNIGTVTSVATGLGLSGGTITTSGTLLVDTSSASILSRQRAAATYAPISINGTVTSVSVATANGVSGSVATATTTPAITLTLGAITPTTVNGNTFTTGSSTYTGTAAMTYTMPDTSGTLSKIVQSASVTGTDDTTTLTVIGNAAGLTCWGRANKKYRVTAALLIGCDNTGGVAVGIGGPSGSAVVGGQWVGISSTASTVHTQRLGNINNVVGTPFNRFNNATGSVALTGYITTSSTAGAITIVFKSATLGNKSTIFIGSTMDIQEVQ